MNHSALKKSAAKARHPFGCRVVTATEGNTPPELLQQARNGPLPDGLKLGSCAVFEFAGGGLPHVGGDGV